MTDLYIRFGVHKDREVLKEMSEHMTGICVPAHILAYTPDPTKAAIYYTQKPFFIDPMTYRFAEQDISTYVVVDTKDKKSKFKPSIKKLVEKYALTDFFDNNGFKPIQIGDFDDVFIDSLSKEVIEMQKNMVDEGKDSAMDRYAELLSAIGKSELVRERDKDHKPAFYLTPYFFFSDIDDKWLDINLKLAEQAKSHVEEGDEVVPVILTNASTLTADLLTKYSEKGFQKVVLWLSDLEERSKQTGEVQETKLVNYVTFAQTASQMGIDIIAMHSSYFSVVLSKTGVHSIAHGLLHGEYKNKKAQIGGGAPPARYYIRSIHNFLPIPATRQLFNYPEAADLLDFASDPCMKMIKGDAKNIYDVFESNVPLSQKHFLHARNAEIEFVNQSSVQEIIAQLKSVYEDKRAVVEKVAGEGYLDYLLMWATALEKTLVKD